MAKKKNNSTLDIQEALGLFEKDQTYWNEMYEKGREDLFFLSDDPDAQWEASYRTARTERKQAALTIDQLSQFVHQVENDIRMNTPSINVIPDDSEATDDVADVYKGIIRSIEYKSKADDAYDMSVSFSIRCGIGFLRVDHDYVRGDRGIQDLQIKRVINPFAVFIDSSSIEAAAADAKHAFLLEDIPMKEFERRFPGQNPVTFQYKRGNERDIGEKEYVTIAEFFKIDDVVDEETESVRRVVRRYLLSGEAILEETTFPGEYIPIVPVYGEETFRDGKRHLHSLIRRSKDAQVMYNFWQSTIADVLQAAPQAPIIAPAESIADWEIDYTNPSKPYVLKYKHIDDLGNQIPPPFQLQAAPVPTGLLSAARNSVEDIKATMGMYNASLGARANEVSGVAIQKRQMEGDVATYHFGDNLVKAITQIGQILVSAIPEIYDTPRILRIVGSEDEIKTVGVNGQIVEGQEQEYNLSLGSFSVRVETSAPFTTKRQEAAEFYSQVVSSQPQLMNVMGDLLFKYMDVPGAQAMAARMKKIVPPELQESDGEDFDPEKEQMRQVIEKGQAAMQEMEAQLSVLQQQLADKQAEYALKAAEIETKKQDIAVKAEDNKMDAQLKAKELQIKDIESAAKIELEKASLQADMIKDRSDSVSQESLNRAVKMILDAVERNDAPDVVISNEVS